MSQASTKSEVWEDWVRQTILADIRAADTPDPVRMSSESDGELEMTTGFDSYRLGRGRGDYLYLLYLLDESGEGPSAIRPVYIGETSQVASRLLSHFRKIRDAYPISDWEDDGSWGSYGKHDHIATVYERARSPLYVWILDVAELDTGPYGYSTYRQELEAKTVGLVHSHPCFNRVFANRDFVPNRVAYEIGKAGPDWVDLQHDTAHKEARLVANHSGLGLQDMTKAGLWYEWVDQTICQGIFDPDQEDPIPLFDTAAELTVALTEVGSSAVLKRSEAIDARIRAEGKRCVDTDGVSDGPDGLLYVMYQLASDTPSPEEIVPRYIGKAESYGKKNELSANFEEIAKDRDATRSFARWGDGSYWHVGELSETVFGEDSKKHSWASELFDQATHRLKEQTYLWISAWDSETHPSPYDYPAYLAEVEALLIGLAYETHPGQLLNHNEVPDEAPANQQDFEFRPFFP